MIFTTQPYIQTRKTRKIEKLCTQYEKMAAIALAREQLYFTLSQKRISNGLIAPINSPVFKLGLGVFVTLYKDGKLRGCIGTLETGNDEITVGGNIRKYVDEAALNDGRFEPVVLKEFPLLDYSVTILNEKQRLTLNEYFGNTFVLGRDGIYLKKGGNSGYFLPSVAIENGYDKKTLLEELCVNKAGSSSRECYRGSNVELFYNEGLEFKFS
jgi:AmmeMemoRadiSam system protein A